MKNKIIALCWFAGLGLLSAGMLFGLCSCNRTLIDTTYRFDKAILTLPNGESFEGKVESWIDFGENGEQIQITLNGVTYLTSIDNVILIAE